MTRVMTHGWMSFARRLSPAGRSYGRAIDAEGPPQGVE